MKPLRMTIFGGDRVNPLCPRPQDIKIIPIAHSLANTNRYTGHPIFPYSVAQHSVLLCDYVQGPWKRVALVHDMPESFLTDISRPLKVSLPDYLKIEEEVQRRVFKKFWVQPSEWAELKDFDTRICEDEMRVLFPTRKPKKIVPLGVTVEEWHWTKAKREFLDRCERYL